MAENKNLYLETKKNLLGFFSLKIEHNFLIKQNLKHFKR